ncbi:MAG: hypothetical protein U0163_07735 [Gemmatimonadaceae bacterium]
MLPPAGHQTGAVFRYAASVTNVESPPLVLTVQMELGAALPYPTDVVKMMFSTP